MTNTSLDATTSVVSATLVKDKFVAPDTTKASYAGIPEVCRIVGIAKPVADSNIGFEVWLPLENWNSKFLSAGEGGYAGQISYRAMAINVNRGYATASTDGGHVGTSSVDGDWIVGHPERVIDWGYRAKHIQTVAAKQTIERFYGKLPTRSYFAGCSNGGRSGLMELQRYPDDYDGYVIGSPAFNWTGQTTYWAWMNQAFSTAASQIPSAKLPALKAATLAQCDGIDGVVDGIISNPRACKFNPDVLQCAAGQDNNSCFTAPQVAALKKIYQGPQDSAGRQLFPGDEVGAETDLSNWDQFVTGTGVRHSLGLYTYGRMLHNVTDYDPAQFNFDTDPAILRAVLGTKVNAVDTDLRLQKEKGIKVLHYVGWADAALSPQGSIDYYESVAAKVGGMAKAQEFYKLYMVPGMVHCFGGPGPSDFGQWVYDPKGSAKDDIIKALEQWVEKGETPDTITATKFATTADITAPVVMKRPLCPHPKVQKFVGGDSNIASSFVCSVP
jgi:feruloyl esterase